MAYPAEFSMEKLKSIRSYSGRVKYVQSILPRISSGSSRVVFKVDDEKVLKVAKNDKGIAQNSSEDDWGKQNTGIVAKVFDTDDDGIFLEMELAQKVNMATFKKLAGISLQELELALQSEADRQGGNKPGARKTPEGKALADRLWDESEFFSNLMEHVL